MEFAVKTTQLAKVFSGREVLRDCGLAVERGTVYGLLGRNGAGKTTLFKLLLGYLKPAMGKAEVLGMDSVRDNREILRRTGSLIEAPVFYEHLSAEENLRIHLAYMEMPGKTICGQEQENSRRQKIREQNIQQRIEEVLDLSGLPCTGEQPVGTFSLGMRQRLAIARAVVHRPELLILDEPMNGSGPGGNPGDAGAFERADAETEDDDSALQSYASGAGTDGRLDRNPGRRKNRGRGNSPGTCGQMPGRAGRIFHQNHKGGAS